MRFSRENTRELDEPHSRSVPVGGQFQRLFKVSFKWEIWLVQEFRAVLSMQEQEKMRCRNIARTVRSFLLLPIFSQN